MNIGDPIRTITVEPARVPIPERAPAPAREPMPQKAPSTPERAPERTPVKR